MSNLRVCELHRPEVAGDGRIGFTLKAFLDIQLCYHAITTRFKNPLVMVQGKT